MLTVISELVDKRNKKKINKTLYATSKGWIYEGSGFKDHISSLWSSLKMNISVFWSIMHNNTGWRYVFQLFAEIWRAKLLPGRFLLFKIGLVLLLACYIKMHWEIYFPHWSIFSPHTAVGMLFYLKKHLLCNV